MKPPVYKHYYQVMSPDASNTGTLKRHGTRISSNADITGQTNHDSREFRSTAALQEEDQFIGGPVTAPAPTGHHFNAIGTPATSQPEMQFTGGPVTIAALPNHYFQASGPHAGLDQAAHFTMGPVITPALPSSMDVCVNDAVDTTKGSDCNLCGQQHKRCLFCGDNKAIGTFRLGRNTQKYSKACSYCRNEFKRIREATEKCDLDTIDPRFCLQCSKCEFLRPISEYRNGEEKKLLRLCAPCREVHQTYRDQRFQRDLELRGLRRCVGCNTLRPNGVYLKLASGGLGTTCRICRERNQDNRRDQPRNDSRKPVPPGHQRCVGCSNVKPKLAFEGDWWLTEYKTCRLCRENAKAQREKDRIEARAKIFRNTFKSDTLKESDKPVDPKQEALEVPSQEYFTCQECSNRIKIEDQYLDYAVCTYCSFDYIFSEKYQSEKTRRATMAQKDDMVDETAQRFGAGTHHDREAMQRSAGGVHSNALDKGSQSFMCDKCHRQQPIAEKVLFINTCSQCYDLGPSNFMCTLCLRTCTVHEKAQDYSTFASVCIACAESSSAGLDPVEEAVRKEFIGLSDGEGESANVEVPLGEKTPLMKNQNDSEDVLGHDILEGLQEDFDHSAECKDYSAKERSLPKEKDSWEDDQEELKSWEDNLGQDELDDLFEEIKPSPRPLGNNAIKTIEANQSQEIRAAQAADAGQSQGTPTAKARDAVQSREFPTVIKSTEAASYPPYDCSFWTKKFPFPESSAPWSSSQDIPEHAELRRRVVDKGNRKFLGRFLTTVKRRQVA